MLDTQPPETILISGEPLINKQTINLEILLIDDNDDIKDYTIEYLVNDEFAEWEKYGTFEETSITFGIQHLLLDNRKTCASHGGGLLILLETLQIGDQDGDAKCLDETKQYLLK